MIQIGEYFFKRVARTPVYNPLVHLAIWQVKRLFKAIIPKDSDAVTWIERMYAMYGSHYVEVLQRAPLRV